MSTQPNSTTQNGQVSLQWVDASKGEIPEAAIKAGAESGVPMYICRAEYNGGLYPGKIGRNLGGCHIGWKGQEVVVPTYQVLTAVPVAPPEPNSSSGAAAAKIYELADAIPADPFHLFLSDQDKAQIMSRTSEIRTLALESGCIEVVDKLEKLRALTVESLADRTQAMEWIAGLKVSVRKCLSG